MLKQYYYNNIIVVNIINNLIVIMYYYNCLYNILKVWLKRIDKWGKSRAQQDWYKAPASTRLTQGCFRLQLRHQRRVPETGDPLLYLGRQCGLIRGAGQIAGTPSASAEHLFLDAMCRKRWMKMCATPLY